MYAESNSPLCRSSLSIDFDFASMLPHYLTRYPMDLKSDLDVSATLNY